jgi:hypothetical protein
MHAEGAGTVAVAAAVEAAGTAAGANLLCHFASICREATTRGEGPACMTQHMAQHHIAAGQSTWQQLQHTTPNH